MSANLKDFKLFVKQQAELNQTINNDNWGTCAVGSYLLTVPDTKQYVNSDLGYDYQWPDSCIDFIESLWDISTNNFYADMHAALTMGEYRTYSDLNEALSC